MNDYSPPRWTLIDPQPFHPRSKGPQVMLPITEDGPRATISADHARKLAEQLRKAADQAEVMWATED